jgi:hypothetical protein
MNVHVTKYPCKHEFSWVPNFKYTYKMDIQKTLPGRKILVKKRIYIYCVNRREAAKKQNVWWEKMPNSICLHFIYLIDSLHWLPRSNHHGCSSKCFTLISKMIPIHGFGTRHRRVSIRSIQIGITTFIIPPRSFVMSCCTGTPIAIVILVFCCKHHSVLVVQAVP